jgi:hypothetical protein
MSWTHTHKTHFLLVNQVLAKSKVNLYIKFKLDERRTRQLQTAPHLFEEEKKIQPKGKKREKTRQQTGIFKTCQKDYKKHLLHGTNKRLNN